MSREPVRECPYCHNRYAGRALDSHVRWEMGSGHGGRGITPPNFDAKECEIVGYRDVTRNRRPVKPEHDRYLCRYCESTICRGKRGLSIHVGRVDDDAHKDISAEDIDPTEHMRFPATKDKKILVPSDAYKLVIDLDEDEKEDGWEVVVDPNVGSMIEVSDVLAVLRQYYTRKTVSGEDTDPVEAYNYIQSQLANG